jgi:hypothetical protein
METRVVRLLVKATSGPEAAEMAVAHGLRVQWVKGTGNPWPEYIVQVEVDHGPGSQDYSIPLNNWMLEHRDPPFPVSTLLHWSPVAPVQPLLPA